MITNQMKNLKRVIFLRQVELLQLRRWIRSWRGVMLLADCNGWRTGRKRDGTLLADGDRWGISQNNSCASPAEFQQVLNACSRAAVQACGGCSREVILQLSGILQAIQLPQTVLENTTFRICGLGIQRSCHIFSPFCMIKFYFTGYKCTVLKNFAC
jgi:hypothetical protein